MGGGVGEESGGRDGQAVGGQQDGWDRPGLGGPGICLGWGGVGHQIKDADSWRGLRLHFDTCLCALFMQLCMIVAVTGV